MALEHLRHYQETIRERIRIDPKFAAELQVEINRLWASSRDDDHTIASAMQQAYFPEVPLAE